MNNYVKDKIRSRKDVSGIWSIIPSSMVTEIIASTGLDFVLLDMEHGGFNVDLINESVRSISGYQCSPIVRIPFIEQTLIQRLLDTGVHGIIAPQIKKKEDAKELIDCCRFSPVGKRGYNPFTKAGDFFCNHQSSYLKDDFLLISIIIENIDAYNNLDELLEFNEIDVFYLGIYDMSCAFGIRGQMDHSLIAEFIQKASEKIIKAGKMVGIMVDSIPENRKNETGSFFVLKPDTYILKKSIMDRMNIK